MSKPKRASGPTVATIMATLKRLRERRAQTAALEPSAAAERQRRREELLASLDGMIARYDRLLADVAQSNARRGQPPARKGGARSG